MDSELVTKHLQCCKWINEKSYIFLNCGQRWLSQTHKASSQHGQFPDGLTAQLVEQCTGISEVMGSNPVQAWIYFSAQPGGVALRLEQFHTDEATLQKSLALALIG